MDIKGKNIIVTGGASGIGKALATKLIEEGANVGVFDINEPDFQGAKFYKCDVSDLQNVEAQVEKFFGDNGSIDALVNNAGIVKDAPLLSIFGQLKKHDIETWNKILATNLTSVFYMTREVVEKMFQKRTKGVVVNVSSIVANGNPGQSAYAAAKAGIDALTKTWANELNLLGIRVAGIAPGFTLTKIAQYSMNEKIKSDWEKRTPLRRMAKPEEIADGIIFIIKNDFFHGKILQLDGGLTM
ncbi:hypothetical protein A2448_03710 [Candidatus Peregrinibacteria bacterium RIFOXYC2_FULL_41_22]|nr:MAG: hypothetical protein A2448_03710 [Candidatus Peregrinibacteria bacterium RIFOXYC2_FULL_41_22]